MRGDQARQSLSRILPALVHVQANLGGDLSLDVLAAQAGLSKYHFHQLFRTAIGETPKAYVERLRLEWAAVQLRIRRLSVLEVALECGYQNHETFTRAFRTRFAMSPRDYRRGWSRRKPSPRSPRFVRAGETAPDPLLSPTRIVRLTRMTVGFIRHTGPYESVPAEHFTRLLDWSRRRGVGAPLLLGIARDAPGITPDSKIRFDCCVQVPQAFEVEGDIGCQRTPAGTYALTDYVGSWDLAPAYRTILERLTSDPALEIIGLPAIELYQTTRVGHNDAVAQVSIAIPVAGDPLGTGARWHAEGS
jgi:AraC family transcriptional regulator